MPTTFRHSANGGRRITTPSSGDISELLVRHLNKTFPPLEFPPALARAYSHTLAIMTLSRATTRVSFSVGLHLSSHFYRSPLTFAIAGRWKLEAYMVFFLQRLPAAAENDHSRIAGPCFTVNMISVNTSLLGDYRKLCAGSRHAPGNRD